MNTLTHCSVCMLATLLLLFHELFEFPLLVLWDFKLLVLYML